MKKKKISGGCSTRSETAAQNSTVSQKQTSKNTTHDLENSDKTSDGEISISGIRQTSRYDQNNKPLPDNNMFFEERHNPLSSKGN